MKRRRQGGGVGEKVSTIGSISDKEALEKSRHWQQGGITNKEASARRHQQGRVDKEKELSRRCRQQGGIGNKEALSLRRHL